MRQVPLLDSRLPGQHRRLAALGLVLTVALLGAAPVGAAMALNPDVRQTSIQQTICTSGYSASVRPSTSYTNGVKRKLLRNAGQSESATQNYELDHIVPLALGGHPRSLDNLMLQPWEGSDGAKRKDRLEVKLQCLVCTGQVPLADAQREIYRDWQGAYHRYATVKCHRSRKPRAEPRLR